MSVANDVDKYHSWMLVTHPGSLTYSHRDSGGALTWIRCIRGFKIWVGLFWKRGFEPGAEDWDRRNWLMMRGDVGAIEYSRKPPWVRKGKIDWAVYVAKGDKWEKYRVADWRCICLEENETL